MFGKGITLFKLFGFKVKIDFSWLILGLLITWTLAEGLFPYQIKGLHPITYWIMGVAGALGLLFSIVFHELWHSLIARKFGLSMRGITLFIFGGVAEMTEEPPSPKAEFFMAVAGPISSVVLSLGLFAIFFIGAGAGWPKSITVVINYLAFLNLILAGFNLMPAFPLDGGRVLRSVLWGWKDNIRWATQVSSKIGGAFGIALIVHTGRLSVCLSADAPSKIFGRGKGPPVYEIRADHCFSIDIRRGFDRRLHLQIPLQIVSCSR
jgi:Zn-dependent protease